MALEACPACRGLNFPGWTECEDCGCPKGAKQDVAKAYWRKQLPGHLAMLREGAKAAAASVPRPAGKWRVLGVSGEERVPVWKDDPVDEAQAREWIAWTRKRVQAGKAAFQRILLVNPFGQIVEQHPC